MRPAGHLLTFLFNSLCWCPNQVRAFNDDYFDVAVYDPPTTLTQRHNEVIFEASSTATATAGPMMRVPEGVLAQLRDLYAELFN